MNKPEQTIEEILEKHFTGEQYDEIHGTFIRIPFTKQMEKATHAIEQLITEARIDEVYKMFGHPKKGEIGYTAVKSRISELEKELK